VSFAATELAIEVARQKGAVSTATVAAGAWRSDLFDMTGTTIRLVPVVMGSGGWAPAPSMSGAPILPPVLPVPIPGLSSLPEHSPALHVVGHIGGARHGNGENYRS
jgi:hypothetical protein